MFRFSGVCVGPSKFRQCNQQNRSKNSGSINFEAHKIVI